MSSFRSSKGRAGCGEHPSCVPRGRHWKSLGSSWPPPSAAGSPKAPSSAFPRLHGVCRGGRAPRSGFGVHVPLPPSGHCWFRGNAGALSPGAARGSGGHLLPPPGSAGLGSCPHTGCCVLLSPQFSSPPFFSPSPYLFLCPPSSALSPILSPIPSSILYLTPYSVLFYALSLPILYPVSYFLSHSIPSSILYSVLSYPLSLPSILPPSPVLSPTPSHSIPSHPLFCPLSSILSSILLYPLSPPILCSPYPLFTPILPRTPFSSIPSYPLSYPLFS